MKRLLIALLMLGVLSCAERRDPDGVSGAARVTRLDRGTMAALRDSFNAASDRGRILVLLSPT